MNLLNKNLKNLQEIVKNNPKQQVFFFDESRFGTHAKHGLGWFEKGSITPVLTKLGYESFYLQQTQKTETYLV